MSISLKTMFTDETCISLNIDMVVLGCSECPTIVVLIQSVAMLYTVWDLRKSTYVIKHIKIRKFLKNM